MTKNHYIKHGVNPKTIRVAGYIKSKDIKPLRKDSPLRKGIILMAGGTYENSNHKLLNIIKNITNQYDFCLKLHPSLDYTKYKSIAEKKWI